MSPKRKHLNVILAGSSTLFLSYFGGCGLIHIVGHF